MGKKRKKSLGGLSGFIIVCCAIFFAISLISNGMREIGLLPTLTPRPTATNTSIPTNTPKPTLRPKTTPAPTSTPRPAATNTTAPTAIAQNTIPVVTANDGNVNLRNGPGADYNIVASLPAGQTLEIIGRNADSSWWQVTTPIGDAWIAASVTTSKNSTDAIPVIEAQPIATQPPSATTQSQPAGDSPDLQQAQVINVVDGDTIDVLIDGQEYRIRYILVDTPETKHPTKPIEPFGPEASEANRRLVEGKPVQLEKDVSETDQFGRLLRYVYVDNVMVNEELLRLGLAQVSTYPPDVKYADRFLAVQQQAQAQSLGIWGQPIIEPTPIPAPPAQTTGYTGPYDPAGSDRDCGDFSSWSQAQAFYEAAGGPSSDPHRLDRDRDGIACETLQ